MAGETPEIVIDGVGYELVDAKTETLDRKLYLMAELQACGRSGALAAVADTDDPVRGGLLLLGAPYASGHAFTLLAALYKRRGEPWTREQAATNAVAFVNATGDASDALVRGIAFTLRLIFGSGSSSARTSPTSIGLAKGTMSPSAPAPSTDPPSATTGNSTRSSGRSATATPRAAGRSRSGRSGKRSSLSAKSAGAKPAINIDTTS